MFTLQSAVQSNGHRWHRLEDLIIIAAFLFVGLAFIFDRAHQWAMQAYNVY